MAQLCSSCGREWDQDYRPAFRETCENCGQHLHICRNCRLYDPSFADSCAEPMAERVADPDEGNYCPFFDWKETNAAEKSASDSTKSKARDAFKDLFGGES